MPRSRRKIRLHSRSFGILIFFKKCLTNTENTPTLYRVSIETLSSYSMKSSTHATDAFRMFCLNDCESSEKTSRNYTRGVFFTTKAPFLHMKKEPCGSFSYSPLKGRRATILAFLIASESSLWCLAQTPVIRRGRIFPFSVMNFLSLAESL